MSSNARGEAGKCVCHAQGYRERDCSAKSRASATQQRKPTSRDTAITSEIWGKHGSKTSGRIEMFLKVRRGISKKGSFLGIGTNETEEAESSG